MSLPECHSFPLSSEIQDSMVPSERFHSSFSNLHTNNKTNVNVRWTMAAIGKNEQELFDSWNVSLWTFNKRLNLKEQLVWKQRLVISNSPGMRHADICDLSIGKYCVNVFSAFQIESKAAAWSFSQYSSHRMCVLFYRSLLFGLMISVARLFWARECFCSANKRGVLWPFLPHYCEPKSVRARQYNRQLG
jgi:hypothetical protein